MSRHIWKAAAAEAADSGRDVISLYVTASEDAAELGIPECNELSEAIQNAIYPLDDRWTLKMKSASAAIRRDNAFRMSACSAGAIRLVSSGTADLFGVTQATGAAEKLSALVRDTRDMAALRARLQELPAPAVLAYGRLAAALSKLRSPVAFELATPAGLRSETEISHLRLQEACAYIEETRVSSIFMPIRGSLTALNPAGRTFRLEGNDGRSYAGRLAIDIRQQYGKLEDVPALPIIAEALIERRTTYRVSIDEETTVDILTQLDTDPGMNLEETLQSFRILHDRLNAALEQDGGYDNLPPLSAADYTELAGLSNRLLDSNPLKGARRALDPADLAELQALLADGKPIGRLAQSDGIDAEEDEADGYDPGPAARAARQRAAVERQKLAAAAYADIVKLTGRLAKMIDDLEHEA